MCSSDLDPITVATEMVYQEDPAVEEPEIVARQAEVRRESARKPTYVLTSVDVRSVRHGVLEADVRRKRFRHHAGAAEPHASCHVGANQRVPVGQGRLRNRPAC